MTKSGNPFHVANKPVRIPAVVQILMNHSRFTAADSRKGNFFIFQSRAIIFLIYLATKNKLFINNNRSMRGKLPKKTKTTTVYYTFSFILNSLPVFFRISSSENVENQSSIVFWLSCC